jgi:hypothetical protein
MLAPSPNSNSGEYITDGGFRGMFRLLAAGDAGDFTWAAHAGLHLRPQDDAPVPGGPRGSELLFGLAGGARVRLGGPMLVIGPEVFGASAFSGLLGSSTTALEGLLSTRIEGTAESGQQLRVRLGTGLGSDQQFGAPAWRIVVGIEVFDRSAGSKKP